MHWDTVDNLPVRVSKERNEIQKKMQWYCCTGMENIRPRGWMWASRLLEELDMEKGLHFLYGHKLPQGWDKPTAAWSATKLFWTLSWLCVVTGTVGNACFVGTSLTIPIAGLPIWLLGLLKSHTLPPICSPGWSWAASSYSAWFVAMNSHHPIP